MAFWLQAGFSQQTSQTNDNDGCGEAASRHMLMFADVMISAWWTLLLISVQDNLSISSVQRQVLLLSCTTAQVRKCHCLCAEKVLKMSSMITKDDLDKAATSASILAM